MPRYAPSSTVRGRNGPGLVRRTRASISGTSAAPSRTASGSSAGSRVSATIWTPWPLVTTSQPAGGATSAPASATRPPGPARLAASAQSASPGSSGSDRNGATSAWYRSTLPRRSARWACAPVSEPRIGLSRGSGIFVPIPDIPIVMIWILIQNRLAEHGQRWTDRSRQSGFSLTGDGGEAFFAELVGPGFLVGGERGQGARGPAQQEVGQARVAHQHRAVQVGADHLARVRTLGAVAVAHPRGDLRQRADAGPEPGHALVVL